MSELQLEIVTPEKKIVSTPVVVCSCPGVAGEFGVLKDHISLLSALKLVLYTTELRNPTKSTTCSFPVDLLM